MKKWILYLLVFGTIFSLCACDNSPVYSAPQQFIQPETTQPEIQLSDSCDYILCAGTDSCGNTYELVASQEETALGYEITVGIIMNNEWIYPMSSDFPFLMGGLFPIDGGTALTRVTSARQVATHIYFIDSGAFAMEYCPKYDMYNTLEIFNCTTMQHYTCYGDEYTWRYLYSDAEFTSDRYTEDPLETYNVRSYGYILTDDGQILLTKKTWDYNDSKTYYDWFVLDTKTMEMQTIVTGAEINPDGVLAEGLIFASDHCFYNLNMEKVIDLSHYDIDVWENNGIYFKKGTCTFIAENDLGTKFEVTIDSTGEVLSEVRQ